MKITMNIDCTPEEARTFLGLPDVRPMQEDLMRQMHERLTTGIRAMDATDMLRAWMPSGNAFEQFQAMFGQMPGSRKE
jgi:Family of unknown function (DUF6489)